MDDKLTPSQEKGIKAADRDLCVVAGPGSGKTRVLVERFVNLVTTRKASINEILTLTFTEKAANEMKIRVAGLLERKGMEEERQQVEFAYLSTIHSFCARLLRENAIEAGIDPQFRVLDELEANRLEEQILENVLRKWIEDDRLDTLLNDISWKQVDVKRSRTKSFKESLIQLHEKIRNACQPISGIVKYTELSGDITDSHNKINDIVSEINRIYSGKKLADKTEVKVKGILDLWNNSPLQKNINELHRKKRAKKDYTGLSLLQEVKDIKSMTKGNVSKDVKLTFKGLSEELENLMGLIVEDYSTDIKEVLREFLMDFDTAYSEKKRAECFIDFTDLEEKTIELLRENKYVTNEIKRKFKHILVDEFQDTSRLQESIIGLIRGKDNLFVVGDEKQSIYGFRNADVEIFQEVQRKVDPDSLIYLSENFRSRPQILKFINHIFDNIWTDNTDNQQERCNEAKSAVINKEGKDSGAIRVGGGQSLRAGAEFSRKTVPSIEMIVSAGENKAQARKWESIEIAKRIKEIVEKGEIRITNKREKERSLSYKDFVILFRSTTDIKLYEGSLGDFEIPYYVVSGRGFFNTTEITDLINLLKAIESPLDEINLAAVLKSPFVGIDDESLFWLADCAHNNNNRRRYLYQVLNEVANIKEIEMGASNKITQFLQLLKEIQSIRPRTSLWRLISIILKRTGFQSRMLLFSNGKKRYANLIKIIELCRSREEFEPISLRDFIEIVEGHKYREVRESEAPVESEEDDVVKLTTVHAAKGLEFPVVIIADVDRGKANKSDYFVYSKDYGISFKILNPLMGDDEVPLSYKRINEEVDEKELQESKRLLYVAMTRAQEHLIISAAMSKDKDGKGKIGGDWLKDLYSVLGLSKDLKENPGDISFNGSKHKSGPASADQLRFIPITEEGKVAKTGKRKRLLSRHKKEIAACSTIKAPSLSKEIINECTDILSAIGHDVPVDNSHYVYSVTEILKFHFCPQLYYLKYVLGVQGLREGLRFDVNPESAEDKKHDDEIPGHELGNIAHQVLKKYHLREGESVLRDYIKGEFKFSGFDAGLSKIDLVASWVNSFYKSDVGREAASSSQQKRETSFIFKYQDNLIRGQLDLFYFNNEGMLKIVDYKTNDISTEEIPEKVKLYQLQMQLYTKALEAIYEKEVNETILYFLVPNQPVVIDATEEACKELCKTMNTFFSAHKKGDFIKANKQECRWCEFETICN